MLVMVPDLTCYIKRSDDIYNAICWRDIFRMIHYHDELFYLIELNDDLLL